jgi:hypothetical protein
MRNGHGLELGPDATGEAADNSGLSWVQIEICFPPTSIRVREKTNIPQRKQGRIRKVVPRAVVEYASNFSYLNAPHRSTVATELFQ